MSRLEVFSALGAGIFGILAIIFLLVIGAFVIGISFTYLVENVLLQRGVELWAWSTVWKGASLEILSFLIRGIKLNRDKN
jgi:hypothetical protein